MDLTAGPNRSKVLLDNHRVRVLELRLGPGESEPLHSHPDYLVYVLSAARMRMQCPEGGGHSAAR